MLVIRSEKTVTEFEARFNFNEKNSEFRMLVIYLKKKNLVWKKKSCKASFDVISCTLHALFSWRLERAINSIFSGICTLLWNDCTQKSLFHLGYKTWARSDCITSFRRMRLKSLSVLFLKDKTLTNTCYSKSWRGQLLIVNIDIRRMLELRVLDGSVEMGL